MNEELKVKLREFIATRNKLNELANDLELNANFTTCGHTSTAIHVYKLDHLLATGLPVQYSLRYRFNPPDKYLYEARAYFEGTPLFSIMESLPEGVELPE